MTQTLKLLLAEDNPVDAELVLRQLRRDGFTVEVTRVDTEEAFVAALADEPDLVLADYDIGGFNGLHALEILRKRHPDVPFILISGTIGEDLAVEAIKQGVSDYLMKDRLVRLGTAVTQAIAEGHLRRERRVSEAALRASDERFRQIAENIQEVFWMSDPEKHAMLYVSPAYETIWGRPCASVSSDWLQTIHPKDRARVAAAAARQEHGDYDEVYRVVRPDGDIRWVHDRAFPIRNGSGRVYRIVGTAEDVTENRRLEEQFRQVQKMEAIGTLAGGIAHDFNNILAAIMGYAELAKRQMQNQPVVDGHLDALLQAGTRATALVRQIMAFSRQGEHERRPVDIVQVVKEPLELLRSTIPASIAFDVALGDGLLPVLADATQVHQVVMNLCTNASQVMKDGQGRLGVCLEAFEVTPDFAKATPRLRPGPYVRLSVSDTGPGIAPEVIGRIFEPFFTTKGPGEGTGLGLAVVHGIMQSHDGEILVRSRLGEGTTFELYFPVHAVIAPRQVQKEPGKTTPKGNGERILFLDDEKAIVMLGIQMLGSLGYQVEGFSDVMKALARIEAEPKAFDLVVTDLTMSGMTGTQFADRVLKLRPDMPIILTTGYAAALTYSHAQQMGIRELVMKPVSFHALGATVHRVLAEGTPAGPT